MKIFGLPEDTIETMQQTLDLALELNTGMANMYPCQALPGSPLYWTAKKNGWKLPDSYAGYAFLSYESEPAANEGPDVRTGVEGPRRGLASLLHQPGLPVAR